jgi:uncharacterized protein
MRILVSGSTGMVGSDLVLALKHAGHDVLRLVRRRGNFTETQIGWDAEKGIRELSTLEGLDAVVHLAGENIAGGLWTEERKERIHDSRTIGTKQLVETLGSLKQPPKTFVCASAIGYYGNRGNEVLTEVSSHGQGFLAKTCREWESAAQEASVFGIRVVSTRFGIILSPKGGALKAMSLPFRLGLAGNLGNGKQYMSWVALEDVVGALLHVLKHDELYGPVNVVSPEPVTNAQFTDAMRKILIPAFLPMHYWTPPAPALAIQALFGEMGQELLLSSQRVKPIRLEETGYSFKYPQIKPTLRALL